MRLQREANSDDSLVERVRDDAHGRERRLYDRFQFPFYHGNEVKDPRIAKNESKLQEKKMLGGVTYFTNEGLWMRHAAVDPRPSVEELSIDIDRALPDWLRTASFLDPDIFGS